jgi:hypothetical protein
MSTSPGKEKSDTEDGIICRQNFGTVLPDYMWSQTIRTKCNFQLSETLGQRYIELAIFCVSALCILAGG